MQLMNTKLDFGIFVQAQANRIVQGHFRYGAPQRRRNYMTRIEFELDAYKVSGNLEHLFNIANYCILENIKPQNKKFHLNVRARSATRGKV